MKRGILPIVTLSLSLSAGLCRGWQLRSTDQVDDQRLVTLNAQAVTAADLSRQIGTRVGAKFIYIPIDPHQTVSIQFQELPLDDVVQVLGRDGLVAYSRDLLRDGAATETVMASRITLSAAAASGSMIAELLAGLTGNRIVFRPRDQADLVALDLKEVSIRELSHVLAAYGEVRVSSR